MHALQALYLDGDNKEMALLAGGLLMLVPIIVSVCSVLIATKSFE